MGDASALREFDPRKSRTATVLFLARSLLVARRHPAAKLAALGFLGSVPTLIDHMACCHGLGTPGFVGFVIATTVVSGAILVPVLSAPFASQVEILPGMVSAGELEIGGVLYDPLLGGWRGLFLAIPSILALGLSPLVLAFGLPLLFSDSQHTYLTVASSGILIAISSALVLAGPLRGLQADQLFELARGSGEPS